MPFQTCMMFLCETQEYDFEELVFLRSSLQLQWMLLRFKAAKKDGKVP